MNLGENIYCLRTGKKLSQEELAALLKVSRQSISKWENNASIPELEKLVQMAEIFEVSLDTLVQGTKGAETAASQTPNEQSAERKDLGTQKIIGVVLLCFACLIALVLFFMGGGLFSLLVATPFLACGLICLKVRHRTGLWCAWAVWLSVELYLRYATGIHWQNILMTHLWEPSWNYIRLAFAWVMAVIPVVLILCTARSFRNIRCPFGGKLLHYVGGWISVVGLRVLCSVLYKGLLSRFGPGIGEPINDGLEIILFWFGTLEDWAMAAMLCGMLAWTLSLARMRRAHAEKPEEPAE
jgi:transcriptional regulator with XRE-family HTH domain